MAKVPNWECLFVHRKQGLFLSVPNTGWRFYRQSRDSRANLQAASSSSSTWDQTQWKTNNWILSILQVLPLLGEKSQPTDRGSVNSRSTMNTWDPVNDHTATIYDRVAVSRRQSLLQILVSTVFVSSTFLPNFWWCRRRCWQRRRVGQHLCDVHRDSTVHVGDDCVLTDLVCDAPLHVTRFFRHQDPHAFSATGPSCLAAVSGSVCTQPCSRASSLPARAGPPTSKLP